MFRFRRGADSEARRPVSEGMPGVWLQVRVAWDPGMRWSGPSRYSSPRSDIALQMHHRWICANTLNINCRHNGGPRSVQPELPYNILAPGHSICEPGTTKSGYCVSCRPRTSQLNTDIVPPGEQASCARRGPFTPLTSPQQCGRRTDRSISRQTGHSADRA